ncbi:MAG TPA: PqqD family protein [Candidatus Mediterraneibacter excrementigallinarum]|nr:PqqD family protein [Candidatus Mediterraneibacter excrementigallinarum]
MKRENHLSETLSGSESQEHLPGGTNEGDVRMFKANPNFLLREVAGEAVLVPVGEAGIFENSVISLNETCRFLWQLFQEPRTLEDVIAEARKEYSDPDGEMEQGIYDFIREYLKYGLLKEE